MLDSKTVLILVAAAATTAHAHIALWDKGLFGLNYPGQATDAVQNYNNNAPVNPLREADALSQSQWFGHGFVGYPPAPGNYMVLPSGGTYNGELDCNRGGTSLRDPSITDPLPYYACGGVGALHVVNQFNQTVDNQWFGGSALAIAYTSNANTVQPNDFTVVSVNHNTVWTREVAYAIPAGMPPCPAGGCLCTWNWIHEADHGEGYPFEMYNNLYRCQVSGSTNAAAVVQRGAVPVDCTSNSALCVKGPKTPMYIYQANGNNLPHLDTPPNYQLTWGFADGAQTDIFQKASAPAPSTGMANPYASPTGTATAGQPTPTATALPDTWIGLGCQFDSSSSRALPNGAYQQTQSNSYQSCIAFCSGGGFKYAGVEYGDECWCANEANLQSANASDCNSHCSGDPWAYCGGSYRINVFLSVYMPGQGNASASVTAPPTGSGGTSTTSAVFGGPTVKTTGLPAGWASVGCVVDSGSPRALNRGSTTLSNNTATTCIAECTAQGYPWAGLEYGNECWCGDQASIVAAPASDCNVVCAGDGGTYCGGSWRMDLYGNAKVYPTSSAASTVKASTSVSASSAKPTASTLPTSKSSSTLSLPTSVKPSSSASTSAKPSSTSTSISKPAASTSVSSVKAGSSTIPLSSATAVPSRSTSVVGSIITSALSSSTSAAAPSSTPSPLPSGWAALGCFADSATRLLPVNAYQSYSNTPALCISTCASRGYAYAGVEYGVQCFCASAPSASVAPGSAAQKPATDCNMPCSGDKTQLCGAGLRLNVYSNNATAVAAAKAAGVKRSDANVQERALERGKVGRFEHHGAHPARDDSRHKTRSRAARRLA